MKTQSHFMQQNSLKKLLFLVLLLTSRLAFSQDYLFKKEQISVEDGLSNRFVRSILQDAKGFMWFATQYGLNRYDGYQFKVLTKEENGLQSNFIDKVYSDADSNLWVGHSINNRFSGTFSGIDLVNINTFEVQPIEEQLDLPFGVDALYQITPSSVNDNLYLLTTQGEIYLYKGQNQFELFYKHDKDVVIHDLRIDTLYDWLYCGDEVVALDKEQKLVDRVKIESSTVSSFSNFITSIDSHTIWLVSYTDISSEHPKVWSWDLKTSLEEHTTLEFLIDTFTINPHADFLEEDIHDCAIYFDRYHLRIYNSNRECIYYNEIDGKTFIREIYLDRQSNLWVANSSQGVLKISYQENKFKPHLVSHTLRALTTVRDDSILFATRITKTKIKNLHTTDTTTISTLGRSLYKTIDEQTIWVGTVEAELKKINAQSLKEEETYTYKASNKYKEEQMKIGWSVYKDRTGCIWLGTSRGLAYLEDGMDSLEVYVPDTLYRSLANSIVTSIHENDQGLWVGTSQGLYQMSLDKKVKAVYRQKKEQPFHLPHEYILDIHEDEIGNFWLSTRGGGIINLEVKTGKYRQFTIREGLSHNVVYAILEDEKKNFWLSSDNGLMRFNTENYIVNTYLPSDGILHEEFNHPSAYKSSKGLFYLGGINGVIEFNPMDFYDTLSSTTPLEIVGYQCFNGEKGLLEDQTQALVNDQTIVLNHTDRFFVLSFALLDYKSGYKKHYAYQIEGLDEEWNYIESNSIRINGLEAGTYVLRVKGQGSNGVWSSTTLEIPIIVKKPFYLTFGFIVSLSLIVLLLLLGYFRWRVIRLRKAKEFLEKEVQKRTEKIAQQADELRALDNVKSRFFANISHELRTPLTLITGPINAILERYYGTDWNKIDQVLEVVKRNGDQLEKLIEEILLLSKLEAGNILPELKRTHLFTFLQGLFTAFEVEAELKGLVYELNYDLDKGLYLLLDENKLEKIINNLLSNAFKYTSNGKIALNVRAVSIRKEAVSFAIEVIDSGKGISKADLDHVFDRYYQSKDKEASIEGGVGIGLALASEFANVLGGKLSVESTKGIGSAFNLYLTAKRLESTSFISEVSLESSFKEENKNLAESIFKESTILVVEDNVDMRSFLADLLQPHYQILLAENGIKALCFLNETNSKVDLIVSDIMMPQMDGFGLLKEVKAHHEWRKLPMIMLTARTAEKDKLSALRIGVDDYLSKPFSHQELLIRIKNLLENYQERSQVQTLQNSLEENVSVVTEQPVLKGVWLKELEAIVLKEVGNSQLSVVRVATDLNISERQLRRKIKAQTGLTPHRYFTLIKLEVARENLEQKRYETVAEVAYRVGFSNVSHFSKIYEEQYGKRPSAYLK